VQRSGNAAANGFGSVGGFPASTTCTPSAQVAEVPAMVSGGKTFKRGVAAVSVNIFACDEFQSNCASATHTREIRIVDEIK
jgi:hypothetical protein